jgi:hypothetical protein
LYDKILEDETIIGRMVDNDHQGKNSSEAIQRVNSFCGTHSMKSV